MVLWRGFGWVVCVLGLSYSCGGQSNRDDDGTASGSSGGGNGGSGQAGPGGSGRSGKGGGGGGGNVGSGASGGKATAGRGGSGVGTAGSAGEGAVSGVGGAGEEGGLSGGSGGSGAELPCGCEETCVSAPSGFCPNYLEIACPAVLERAQRLDVLCERDAHDVVYSDCDGHVTLTYGVGYENHFELVFSEATGELVYGEASVYEAECSSSAHRAGVPVTVNDCRSCAYCAQSVDEEAAAGAGGAGGTPRCAFDEKGRLIPP